MYRAISNKLNFYPCVINLGLIKQGMYNTN